PPEHEAPAEEPPPAVAQDAQALLVGLRRSPHELLDDRARGLLSDIGMLGLMRRPDELEFWQDLEKVERRLFARADALIALGPHRLALITEMLDAAPVPDAETLWTAIFVYGCLAGSDAADQVV